MAATTSEIPNGRNGTAKIRVRRLVVSLAIIALSAIHPPDGLGVTVCPMRLVSTLPCPGCGITRSMSCTVRGMFADAIAYNPFGVVIIAACVIVALIAVLPSRWTQALQHRNHRAIPVGGRCLWSLAAAFIVFGIVRATWRLFHA